MHRFLTRTLPISLLAAIGYSFIFQLLYNSMRYSEVWPYRSSSEFAASYLYNFFPIWLSILFVWIFVFCNAERESPATKVAIDVSATVAWLVATNMIFSAITGMSIEWAGTVFDIILILVFSEAFYFWSRFRDSLIRESRYREEAILNRYRTLRMQINPHFLFNSLNILNSLITIDTQKSRDFVNALSKLYRYIMSNEGNDTILISEEISFMDNYLHVLKIRYMDKLHINVVNSNPPPDVRVVAYTLQLLLENIIKHNVISSAHPMSVDINIGDDTMTVCNKLKKKRSQPSSGLGLRYLTEMYARFGLNFSHREDEDQFTVTIPYIRGLLKNKCETGDCVFLS